MAVYEDEQYRQLVRKIEPEVELLRAWQLEGGVSARVTALEMALPAGGTRKLVVRLHGATDLARNPNVAADEFRLLGILRTARVPVPEPLHLEPAGDIFPTPCLVIEYIDGQPDFAPADLPGTVRQMASQLAAIHSIDPGQVDLSFLPRQEDIYARKLGTRPAKLDGSLEEGRIRDVLEAVWPLLARNRPALLHGDYWPGNILWREGKLAGIVDWEDARVGDPLEDLANSRLEMLWAFDGDAMDVFTREYAALTGIDLTHLPYWDLCAALRPVFKLSTWATDPAREQTMRERHHLFVAQALWELRITD